MQRLPSRMEIQFYHTCPFRPREVQRGELRLGGLPGGIGIKVGKMIRSRRKPGQCLSARNHKRNHYQTAPFHAESLRSATTPGYGRRMDDWKVRDCECVDAVGSNNCVWDARIRTDNARRRSEER